MLTYAGAYLKHKGDYFKTNNDKIEVIDLAVTICQWQLGTLRKKIGMLLTAVKQTYRPYS